VRKALVTGTGPLLKLINDDGRSPSGVLQFQSQSRKTHNRLKSAEWPLLGRPWLVRIESFFPKLPDGSTMFAHCTWLPAHLLTDLAIGEASFVEPNKLITFRKSSSMLKGHGYTSFLRITIACLYEVVKVHGRGMQPPEVAPLLRDYRNLHRPLGIASAEKRRLLRN
jgi:hypothetical protein